MNLFVIIIGNLIKAFNVDFKPFSYLYFKIDFFEGEFSPAIWWQLGDAAILWFKSLISIVYVSCTLWEMEDIVKTFSKYVGVLEVPDTSYVMNWELV